MAYYQGDYYQGDYYQGDPFLGSLLGLGAKWIGKGFKKIFRKKPAAGSVWGGSQMVKRDRGMLVSRLGSAAGRIARTGAGAVGTGMAFGAGERIMMPSPQAMFGGPQYRPPTSQFVGPPAPGTMEMTGCCPSGYHLAKDGSGRCVRNRSMNVANPRALRRSLRRVAGFGKLAQRSKRDVQRAARSLGVK